MTTYEDFIKTLEIKDRIETPVQESSLSRIFSLYKKHDTGTISAFRSAEDCGKGVKISNKTNLSNNAILKARLLKLGYGVTHIKGYYIENYKSDNEIHVNEESFFVVDLVDSGNLKKDLKKLGEYFKQDSITFSDKDGSYYLIGTSKCEDSYPGYGIVEKLGSPLFSSTGEFYSKVNGRPFVFSVRNDRVEKLTDHTPTEIRSINHNNKLLEDSLNESNLKKTWAYNNDYECANITAFRKSECCDKKDCGVGEYKDKKPLFKKDNLGRNSSLLYKLKNFGYTMISIVGEYPEGGVIVKERGFFVVNIKNDVKFFDNIKELGREFEQDSVLLLPKGAVNKESKAYLFKTNECPNNFMEDETLEFDAPHYNEKGDITSYVKGKPYFFESVGLEFIGDKDSFSNAVVISAYAKKNWRDLTPNSLLTEEYESDLEVSPDITQSKRRHLHAHW